MSVKRATIFFNKLIDINYFFYLAFRIYSHTTRCTFLIEWKREHVEICARRWFIRCVCSIELQCTATSHDIKEKKLWNLYCRCAVARRLCMCVSVRMLRISMVMVCKWENRNLYQDIRPNKIWSTHYELRIGHKYRFFGMRWIVCSHVKSTVYEAFNCEIGLCVLHSDQSLTPKKRHIPKKVSSHLLRHSTFSMSSV